MRSAVAVLMLAEVIATFSCMLPLSITAQTVGQPSQRTWPVHRLRPAAFPDLPKNLITELERRGCTIPQPYTDRKSNVIRGEFARPGQTDWAVLCSTQGSTSLLVFLNGKETKSGVLARIPDNPGRIFDWFIRPVGRKFIVGRYQAYGGPKPPPINHQGIESGGDTASMVLYRYRGKWLTLQGSD